MRSMIYDLLPSFFLGSARCFVFCFRKTGVCLLIFIAKFAFLVVVLGRRNEREGQGRETEGEREASDGR